MTKKKMIKREILIPEEDEPLFIKICDVYNTAYAIGEGGSFASLSSTTSDGRPVYIIIGIGDGCQSLHEMCRANASITKRLGDKP